jgi:DNA-binding Lrp family transcriptional regulator
LTESSDVSDINAVALSHHKKPHVVLTERDVQLLNELHDNVVMSFWQVQENVFGGKNHATVMNRLKRLELSGFISRQRIPRIKAWQSKREIGVVFQITVSGLRELAKHETQKTIYERVPAISGSSLDHDLLLNDVKAKLLALHSGSRWVNGRYVANQNGFEKIPDAILELPNRDKVLAIELELNAKSSQRYREIVSALRASQKLERVIYVTSNRQIDQKIMSEIAGYSVGDGHNFNDKFFEFLPLERLKALAA